VIETAPRGRRIALTDPLPDAVLKLADGDKPGAVACILMVKQGEKIDPKSEFGPFTPLVLLDGLGIYGQAIWRLFDGLCGRDPLRCLAVLHAARLKMLPPGVLQLAIAGKAKIDVDLVVGRVKTAMPTFGRTQP
jgi:hypothetical protein